MTDKFLVFSTKLNQNLLNGQKNFWAGTARFYLIFGLGLHIIYIYLRVASGVACVLPKIGRPQLNSTPTVRDLLKDDTSSLTNEWRIKILETNPNGA